MTWLPFMRDYLDSIRDNLTYDPDNFSDEQILEMEAAKIQAHLDAGLPIPRPRPKLVWSRADD
jgi:hypothetical protein